ncbi:MAG: mco [Aeromicrobium sp.]|nr:mco [Aeromicrobium sp.]
MSNEFYNAEPSSSQPSGHQGPGIARRRLLQLTGVAVAGGFLSACTSDGSVSSTPPSTTASSASRRAGLVAGTLPIPPLLGPQVVGGTTIFRLTLQQGKSQFLAGQTTSTFGANGDYLGPTLRAKSSDSVQIRVTNDLGETTTLHWHGMHLPAAMDGGPMQTIENNATWSPKFTIRQSAATLWYHPHMMGDTLRQVGMGLVGLFILDDDDPTQKQLPHTYGVDDIPLILQAQTFDSEGQFVLDNGNRRGGRNNGGRATTLVNGAISPTIDTPDPRLRLRLLNASSQEIYTLGLADGATFHQIASDGGLLPKPVPLSQLRLAPAERAEIVVEVPASGGTVLQSLDRNDGGRGGRGGDNAAPTGPLLTINPAQQKSTAGAPLPATLTTIKRLTSTSATQSRDFILAGDDRDPTINGQSMTSMADLMDMSNTIQVKLDTVEVWNLINRSNDTHVFHVHNTQFQILQRDGAPPAANESGHKDTVVVQPDETVSIILRFTDYSDPNTPYMYHCHLLNHEDNGMMGQFVVV